MKPDDWKQVPSTGNFLEIMEFTGVSGADRRIWKTEGMTGLGELDYVEDTCYLCYD